MGNVSDNTGAAPGGRLACPSCDLLHASAPLALGETARCTRCGTVMQSRNIGAADRIIAASLSMLVLLGLATWSPFLAMSEAGFGQQITLADTARALSDGFFWPMGILLVAVIFAAPMGRAVAILYAILPPRLGRRPAAGARQALRLAQALRPWAMAEIFMIGVAVSMVKLAGLAQVSPGPAFWALGGVVLVIGFESASWCRETLWSLVEDDRPVPARETRHVA